LWPAYERVLERFAHGGVVARGIGPDPEYDGRGSYDKRHAHPDVLVAGGGPAGMAAAVAAAGVGASVMLVEEEQELGGHLRWGDATDLAALQELRTLVDAAPGIEVLTAAPRPDACRRGAFGARPARVRLRGDRARRGFPRRVERGSAEWVTKAGPPEKGGPASSASVRDQFW